MWAHFRTHALALLLGEGGVQVEMNVILGGAALGAIYALATAHIRMSRFGDERYVLDKRAFPDRRAVLTGDMLKRSTVRRQMFPVPEFDMGSFCRGLQPHKGIPSNGDRAAGGAEVVLLLVLQDVLRFRRVSADQAHLVDLPGLLELVQLGWSGQPGSKAWAAR